MVKFKNHFNYFFVDEAGDAVFYNKYGKCIVGETGCSKILLLGFIVTQSPDILRKEVLRLRAAISQDEYLQCIPSVEKTLTAFHAKDDCPEVREKFYKLIKKLDFKTQFFVARKDESRFQKRHKGKQNIFYDEMIIKLFENKLHKAEKNIIYFATRGNRNRQEPLESAVQTAILTFENKKKIKVDSEIKILPQSPIGEPCLQVIDYMNWAVYRAYTTGDMRYYSFIEEKVSYLVDIFDIEKYPKNYYDKSNKFDVKKISPL